MKNNLTMVLEQLPKTNVQLVNQAISHLLVLDVSGSMSYDLPKIRTHLKNRLATLTADGDLLTIIWFSGKNQFGTVFENFSIKTVADLASVNKAIDKWLQPVGLTGFKEPLDLVNETIQKTKLLYPDMMFNMIWFTDGYDNQWSENEIIKSLENLKNELSTATFVEYGYYANHKLLSKMSEITGADLIFSEDFPRYEVSLEEKMKTPSLGKKIKYVVKSKPLDGIVTTLINGSIINYMVNDNNECLLSEGVDEIFYLTEDANAVAYSSRDQKGSLITMSLAYVFANKMQSEIVYDLLNELGNKDLFSLYSKSIGKQKILLFNNKLIDLITTQDTNFDYQADLKTTFFSTTPSLIEVLNELMSDEENKFYPMHQDFVYKRIGRKKEAIGTQVSDEDVHMLEEQIKVLKESGNFSTFNEKITELKEKLEKGKALEFINLDKDRGQSISELIFNQERANISIRARYNGYVILPTNSFTSLPKDMFKTHIYRAYTLLADGILNVKTLPVTLSRKSYDAYIAKSAMSAAQVGPYDPAKIYILDLTQFPVITRKDVQSVDSKQLFAFNFQIQKQKARQKVYKYFREIHFPKTSTGYVEAYGQEATDWLKSLGLTEFNGFNPQVIDSKDVNDKYYASELNLKIKGLSTLPQVKAVIEKMNSGKNLTLSDKLLSYAITEYNQFIESDIYKNNERKEHLLEVWLKDKEDYSIKETRKMMKDLSTQIFSIIVGQVWFNDATDLEEYKRTYELDGENLECTAVLADVEVEI